MYELYKECKANKVKTKVKDDAGGSVCSRW